MVLTKIKPVYDRKGKFKGYLDIYTGEIYGLPVIVGKKRNPYGKGWLMNSQEASVLLAKDKDIKGETHRVLRFIEGILDFENWVYMSITEIAKELDMHRPDVSKSIKILEEKEIILKGPKIGRSYTFMLNPNFGWKGKIENLEEYREKKEKKRFQNLRDKHKKQNLEKLSQEYNIPIEKLLELQNKLSLT